MPTWHKIPAETPESAVLKEPAWFALGHTQFHFCFFPGDGRRQLAGRVLTWAERPREDPGGAGVAGGHHRTLPITCGQLNPY